jgi:hypothetical protein
MSSHRFDRAAADRFLVAVRAGVRDEVAAMHAGVSVSTVKHWLKGDTKATADFTATVNKARADLQLLAVGHIRRSMGEDKGAAQFIAATVSADMELARLRELTT